MLTSFGLSHLTSTSAEEDHTPSAQNIFLRMPPTTIGANGRMLLPDTSVLLLAERIIIDRRSFDLMKKGHNELYGDMGLMIETLYDEGFVRLEDYDSVVTENQGGLERMLERDLLELDSWVDPLEKSLEEWGRFNLKVAGPLQNAMGLGRTNHLFSPRRKEDEFSFWVNHSIRSMMSFALAQSCNMSKMLEDAIRSSRARRKSGPRMALRETLREYLSYVNANLVLSKHFGTGFHDWSDYRPFYADKFSRIAHDSYPGQKEIECVQKLFCVSFPELSFWSPKNVIKALKDKRIADLRLLIDEASSGLVEFDNNFAKRSLSEVLKIERSIGRFRNFVSYTTMPLGFIPAIGTPLQKGVEEIVVRSIESKKRAEHQWFYLISEFGSEDEHT